MSKQILFIQGAGEGTHDAWDNKLAESLRTQLGPDYDVRQVHQRGDAQHSHRNPWPAHVRSDGLWKTHDGSVPGRVDEFARLWRGLDKLVISTTLERASSGKTSIVREFRPEEIGQLKADSAKNVTVAGRAARATREIILEARRIPVWRFVVWVRHCWNSQPLAGRLVRIRRFNDGTDCHDQPHS
jgi:hypothetical protein